MRLVTGSMAESSLRTPVGLPRGSRSMVPAVGFAVPAVMWGSLWAGGVGTPGGAGGVVVQVEGGRVGRSVVAGGVDEPDGIVGGDSIEIGGGDVAVLGELAFVPA